MPHYTFQSSRVRRNVMGMRLLICPLLYPYYPVPILPYYPYYHTPLLCWSPYQGL